VKVLGLDLSLSAPGIALVQPPAEPLGWLVKVGPLRDAPRLRHIGHAVREAVEMFSPDMVAIEGYSFGSQAQAHHIGELGGVVRYLLLISGVTYQEIPPAKWRKQLFGRNVAKDAVRYEAYRRYGIEFDSLDVLEAWCVATAVYRLVEGLDKPAPVRRARAAAS
jgi:Holliday junction resolvasome RuvABC endonuclease subunit